MTRAQLINRLYNLIEARERNPKGNGFYSDESGPALDAYAEAIDIILARLSEDTLQEIVQRMEQAFGN